MLFLFYVAVSPQVPEFSAEDAQILGNKLLYLVVVLEAQS